MNSVSEVLWNLIDKYQQDHLLAQYFNDYHSIPLQTQWSLENKGLIDKGGYLTNAGKEVVEWRLEQGYPFYMIMHKKDVHHLFMTNSFNSFKEAKQKGYTFISKTYFEYWRYEIELQTK